jgi:peptide/nickel transport system substrate-binding protein
VKGDHITLERFEDYWNKAAVPKLFRIIYKIYGDAATLKLALQKGEVDAAWEGIAASDIPSLLKDPSIKTTNVDYQYIQWLTLNTNLPNSPLKDARVRHAIAYSIDQDEISQKIYYNVDPAVKDSVFMPGMMMKPSWRPYTERVNLDKAKQLLADAGYPNGIDVTLWYTPIVYGKEVPDMAVLIQQQLAKAGIRVSFQVLERAAYSSRFRAGEFEMALGIMSPDYPDPDSVANFIASSSGSYSKRVRLNDTMLDKLVVQGQIETDPAKREVIYGQLQDRLADIMPYVPLVKVPGYIFSRTNVSGFEPFYFHFAPWWLVDKDTK